VSLLAQPLFEIKDLKTYFKNDDDMIPAVDGVSFYVNSGETVGIVGESGSGKSVTLLTAMRLLDDTSAKVMGGSIHFNGVDLLSASERDIRKIRGKDMAMIFQEPMTSLNPVHKIGKQIREAIEWHLKLSKKEAQKRTIEMLKLVGIPRAEEIYNDYPHQLSGGMRQRVMIAMAMSCEPKLLIADEPTTALDVTIQAQILELMKKLKTEKDISIILITHDLGVVAEMCDRVVVMYAGRVVEEGPVEKIFENPQHPYTKGLLESTPKLGEKRKRLGSIPGTVPSPSNLPKGCKFAPRCPVAMDICFREEPTLKTMADGSRNRCFLHQLDHIKEGV
jgi:peptide/nickel transport system ATP-binding protein